MSYPFPAAEEVDPDELGLALFRVIFGDRTGARVFLAGMAFFALYWRVGIFSSDTYAVANTLVAVADGHLHLGRIVYGPSSVATPGLHELGGEVYGRNYGHVVLALPVLLVLQVLSLVAAPRLVVFGTWLLAVAGIAIYYADARWRRGGWFGAMAATLVFVIGAIGATPLPRWWLPLVALQLVTMIAASLVAVFVYRLLAREGTSRIAVFGGLAVVLATPVGFWASIPKRHSITALLALLSLYALYRSREAPTVDGETRFRALAYAPAGLTAWIHPAEALALLAAVGVVDLPTARSNHPRRLAVVAGALAGSLLPFLLTNGLISGDPLRPPRLLPGAGDAAIANLADGTVGGTDGVAVDGADDAASGGEPASNTTGESARNGSDVSSGGEKDTAVTPSGGKEPAVTPAPNDGVDTGTGVVLGFLSAVLNRLSLLDGSVAPLRPFVDRATGSIGVLGDGSRMMDVFVHSGYIQFPPHVPKNRSINLTVLESMPTAGAAFVLPALAGRRLLAGEDVGRRRPARITDLAAGTFLLLLAGFYLLRLPAHHMFTVRYLHPLYPIAVYGLCRTAPVRRVVQARPKLLAGSYGFGVAVGLPAYVAALAATDAVLSEAVQLYALVALAIAGLVGAWSVAAAATGRSERWGAIVLGVAAAATTTYLLVSGTALFAFTDNFALPVGRALAEALRVVNPWESLW